MAEDPAYAPDFERALNFVLSVEGVYSHRKDDHGGPTCFGVTQRAYDSNRRRHQLPMQPVKLITKPECRFFYYTECWIPAACCHLPERIAVAHFDASVNLGARQALRLLQRALDISADGHFGPETEGAARTQEEWPLLRRMLFGRARFYMSLWVTDPTQKIFRRGWVNRLRLLRKELRRPPSLIGPPSRHPHV